MLNQPIKNPACGSNHQFHMNNITLCENINKIKKLKNKQINLKSINLTFKKSTNFISLVFYLFYLAFHIKLYYSCLIDDLEKKKSHPKFSLIGLAFIRGVNSKYYNNTQIDNSNNTLDVFKI